MKHMINRRHFTLGAAAATTVTGLLPTPSVAAPNAADIDKPLMKGFVFGPGPSGRCDDKRVGVASVHWDARVERFRMWYCCRDADYPRADAPANMGTGRVALAESQNGIEWTRIDGPKTKGAVLDFGTEPDDFDYLHAGLNDVTYADGAYWMWCFGGNKELWQAPAGEVYGLKMRPGLARSVDGVNWEKIKGPGPGGAAFNYAEDDIFASWTNGFHDGEKFIIQVTTVSSPTGPFGVDHAVSKDGVAWGPRTPIQWTNEPAIWGAGGIMTRQVRRNFLPVDGKWLMTYTALHGDPEMKLQRSISIATSNDGETWTRLFDEPILTVDDENAWDGGGVASPQLLLVDGKLHLYYFGFAKPEHVKKFPKGIGLAVADGLDLRSFKRIA